MDRNRKWTVAFAAAAGVVAVAGSAAAEEIRKDQPSKGAPESRDLPAADRAVELTIGTGYAQGFGEIGAQQASFTDFAEAGGAVQIGAGYRLLSPLTLGVYGSGSVFARGGSADASAKLYSATAGVQGDYHLRPAGSDWDPWVSLGTGWRGYWIGADQGTTSLHGWEIARLQLGVDYRVDPAVAISPVIGADLTAFFTESS
ncbi:MAG: hypothetical protein JOZ69_22930, partial [Myxococcales bacterium]|nr:hypothetical protein [Myxococcales bacterium]